MLSVSTIRDQIALEQFSQLTNALVNSLSV